MGGEGCEADAGADPGSGTGDEIDGCTNGVVKAGGVCEGASVGAAVCAPEKDAQSACSDGTGAKSATKAFCAQALGS